MRLYKFGIAFTMTSAVTFVIVSMCFTARTQAQIPEKLLFQPGSYAHNFYGGSYGQTVTASADLMNEEPAQTIWEETFGSEKETDTIGKASTVVQEPVPYLAYHRNPWTGRTHVVPYESGYANSPDEFPVHQSRFNRWISILPCRTQDVKQIKYASYYDPDPVIVADKPSRCQLILGYPNAGWTSCCENRWGTRMAQCPGVDLPPLGPYAEWGVKNQPSVSLMPGPLGGVFQGVRPIHYGPWRFAPQMNLPPSPGLLFPPTASGVYPIRYPGCDLHHQEIE